jgi:hypothetical protein
MLLLMPLMGFSQLDITMTYKQKEVHSIVIKADSSTLSWKADTIKYDLLFEIKITPTKIAIDGYGTYKITKHEIHGVIDDAFGHWPGYHYFELSNATKLTWIENAIIWEFPIINKKTKTIIFEIEK